jgi:hypothetical protein
MKLEVVFEPVGDGASLAYVKTSYSLLPLQSLRGRHTIRRGTEQKDWIISRCDTVGHDERIVIDVLAARPCEPTDVAPDSACIPESSKRKTLQFGDSSMTLTWQAHSDHTPRLR